MTETIFIICEQALLHFPLILGAYISISLMKMPDLSLESAYVFGALIASASLPFITSLPTGFAIGAAVCISMAAGACVGIVSSFLTKKVTIPHLLSTIITMGIFHGLYQLTTGGYVTLSAHKNILISSLIPLHPELPSLLIIFCTIAALTFYFFKTELGYCLAVFGSNNSFFTHYGISTTYVFSSGIIIANALAGISGYLVAQSNGFADMSMGAGKILLCITTLILGKIIHTKTLSVMTPVTGAFIYFTLQQLLLKLGFNLRYFTMIQAIIVLFILLYHYKTQKNQTTDYLGV